MGNRSVQFVNDDQICFTSGIGRTTLDMSDAIDRSKNSSEARQELLLWAIAQTMNTFTMDVVARLEAQFAKTAQLGPVELLDMLTKKFPEIVKAMEAIKTNGAGDQTGNVLNPSEDTDVPRVGE